ncbi:hypothetical protein GCM10023201_51550 [Actinomycetospora corticicola]
MIAFEQPEAAWPDSWAEAIPASEPRPAPTMAVETTTLRSMDMNFSWGAGGGRRREDRTAGTGRVERHRGFGDSRRSAGRGGPAAERAVGAARPRAGTTPAA